MVPPLHPASPPLSIHLSVCLLICLFVPGCQSKRMGSRLKDAVEAGAALVRLPRGRRGLLGCWAAGLPLLFVLVKQRRHVGRGTDGGVIHKEKHEQQ